ncbi:hypothetical protein K3495_g1498 [Podosphaera aphanis]|nr:hypothetical protein K3495_g1498 [Podosphaera aphanis]
MRVEVGYPDNNDCSNPHTRSKVTVKDFDTKIGTLLNGNQIRGHSVDLDKDENAIFLGRYEHKYSINWVPITLTFSFTVKEHKANHYAKLYKIFGPLDIKILTNYEREFTTHVVAKKRNTAKGLQALIDGKYIVHNDTFVNALITATSPNSQGIIPLQDDFEKNFPDPFSYLPPKGDEPTQCEGIAYIPNKLRQNIFNGYSFVFYEERQYENLLPPITAGGGKAMLHIVKPNETTVDEFMNYINKLTGESISAYHENLGNKTNIVVVRFNPVQSPSTEWYADFGIKLAYKLDCRLAEQNEFLDAILSNDASILRRSLKVEAPEISASCSLSRNVAHGGSAHSLSLVSSQTEEIKSLSPPRRGRTRRAGRSKLLGFDDDFSGPYGSLLDSGVPLSSQNFPDSVIQPDLTLSNNQSTAEASQSQGLFVSQNPNFISENPETQNTVVVGSKRKADDAVQEEPKSLDEAVPMESPIKRRRLDDEKERLPVLAAPLVVEEVDLGIQKDPIKSVAPKLVKKKKIEDIDAEVEKMIREKSERKELNAESKVTEEKKSLEEELCGLDIDEIRNKIQIDMIEVRQPSGAKKLMKAQHCDQWDERWNGRKNFKKFKRQGETRGHRGLDKVIVPLMEARKSNKGKEDNFWNDNSQEITDKDRTLYEQSNLARSRNKSLGLKETVQSSTHELSENEDNTQFRRRSKSSEMDFLSSSTGQPAMNQAQTVTQSRSNQNSSEKGLKRAATLGDLGPNKKPKLMSIKQVTTESDDESDDELKFRFRRKK